MSLVIADYGMGNHASLVNALKRVGAAPTLSSDPTIILSASRLILPGVGAFATAMKQLDIMNLRKTIIDYLQSARPTLGICLGMQIMFERGVEGRTDGGAVCGLGIFKGSVEKMTFNNLKVPHVGFNNLDIRITNGLYSNVIENPDFYFTHSYFITSTEGSEVSAVCKYGQNFIASIQKGNVYATQFHPELSQRNGLTLLKNFMEL